MSSRVGSVGPGRGAPAVAEGVGEGSARVGNRPGATQVDGVSAPPEGQGADVLARPAAPAGGGGAAALVTDDEGGKVVETRRLDPLAPETVALLGGKR